ncbi:MAG: hypothetical protein IJN48_00390 [Clostridia bacterium]|nr:hypothetical protein [Clostridia bacterium]
MITKGNILYADEGMILTDGKTFGRVIYLAEGADASVYCEITKEEFDAKTAETEGDVL